MLFFSPLWILVFLMIKYIFEHYKLHLWKKWGKLIGKQLWNWRVAKLDTLSIHVAKLNLLLVQYLAWFFHKCSLWCSKMYLIIRDTKIHNGEKKTSGKNNNSKTTTNLTVMFFFSPLWILMSLMIEHIFEHYKLHLWKKLVCLSIEVCHSTKSEK